ncbi:hypothetical protein KSP39_PZI007306 [Platanthera zijinensis]|uniref:PWWP domain-containing protein n=1 Tax=Platanthera zijinensis TaxID=2320716 RepID=A0AAP0BPD3_9ASPA
MFQSEILRKTLSFGSLTFRRGVRLSGAGGGKSKRRLEIRFHPMSLEPPSSDDSARSLELNSADMAHQVEPESSREARRSWNFTSRDNTNVREGEENEGSGDGLHLVAESVVIPKENLKKGVETPKSTTSDDVLEVKEAMLEVEEGDLGHSKHPPENKSLVSEAHDIDLNLIRTDGSSVEVEEASKSEPVGETLASIELEQYLDEKQFQSSEGQECRSGFSSGDMVWGKVRSHPWWPGQIYHPSFSSEMALRHKKKNSFLVAYFGDNSFAWNDESRLKHFESCFSQMENQSSMDAFVNAVDDSLREVSRSIEIGMTCACIADGLIDDLKHQVFENAGIKEGTCFPTLDRCLTACSFEPGRLLDFIHDLAQLPIGKYEKLDLVKVKAQLKSFFRLKGYPELPEFFCFGGGISPNEEEVSVHEREEAGEDDSEYKKEGIISDDTSQKEKRRGRGRPTSKKKQIEEHGGKHRSLPELMKQTVDYASLDGKEVKGEKLNGENKQIEDGGKHRSLPELMEKTADYSTLDNEKQKNGMLAPLESSSTKRMIKKRVISDYDSLDSHKSMRKIVNTSGDLQSMSASSSRTKALKVGQRISQVANKMKFSPPVPGCDDKNLHKGDTKANGRISSVPVRRKTPRRDAAALVQDYPASDEMLLQLYSAAKDPTKTYRFQPVVAGFFISWRDSQVSESQVSESLGDEKLLRNQTGNGRGRKRLAEFDLVPAESKSDYIQDSYWADVMFEESQTKSPSGGRKRKAKSKLNKSKKDKALGKSLLSSSLESTLNMPEHLSDCSAILNDKLPQNESPVNLSDDKIVEECSPASLILNFSDPKALPSESNLITIFSQYGTLKEAATEVSKKSRRASVVFKRGADAEVAFSSAGKFSAFGPALVSYRLEYSSPVTPPKDTTPTEVKGDGQASSTGCSIS